MTDIDEVKTRLNIVDVIGKRVSLKKAGRHFKALCPFHNERTPSFIVSPERQMWKCFGCGRGGSVIDFVMEYEHVDFVEALTTLAELAGVKLTRRAPEGPEAILKQKIYEVNHLASEYYHYLLTKHTVGEGARTYLKNRGISDKSIKTFHLGYSPNNWHALTEFLKKKGYDEGLMEKAGLVTRGHDMFRGRIMFTLKDHRGNVVGFSGRLLDPDAKEAKYINTSETPVYTKGNVLYGLDVTRTEIAHQNEAILMEGEFDVISSFQEGVSNVVAIKGSALTEPHVNLLRRFTDRLVFALDSDIAGDAASRRGIEIADRAGLDIRVVTMPQGKDPDEAVRENLGLFKKAIKEAVPVYDYFLSSAIKRFDITTAYGKKKASEELLPILSKIENTIVQGHYIKKLATVFDVSPAIIEDGIKKAAKDKESSFVKQEQKGNLGLGQSRREKLELYVLALLLQGKTRELYEDMKEGVVEQDFSLQGARETVHRLGSYLPKHRIFLIGDFADTLPKELIPVLDSAFLWDISGFSDDSERFAKEWESALHALRREVIRANIAELTSRGEPSEELKTLTSKLRDLEKSS